MDAQFDSSKPRKKYNFPLYTMSPQAFPFQLFPQLVSIVRDPYSWFLLLSLVSVIISLIFS